MMQDVYIYYDCARLAVGSIAIRYIYIFAIKFMTQQILTNLYGKKDSVHSFTKRKSFENLLLLGAIFDQSFVACNLLHTLQ